MKGRKPVERIVSYFHVWIATIRSDSSQLNLSGVDLLICGCCRVVVLYRPGKNLSVLMTQR